MIEVLISPIVEALPEKQKTKAMNILHSFYCWGSMAVVIFSTLYFNIFGIENWRYMSMIWALIPLVNIFLFANVPINILKTHKDNMHDNNTVSIRKLLSVKIVLDLIFLEHIQMKLLGYPLVFKFLEHSNSHHPHHIPFPYLLNLGYKYYLFHYYHHHFLLYLHAL